MSTINPIETNLTFRRRSQRHSLDLAAQKRVRINGPNGSESSDEDETEGDLKEIVKNDEVIQSSSDSFQSASLTNKIELPSSTNVQETVSRHNRRKSLLQKILIKQAVEVHLAQQSEPDELVGVSGISSSSDDDEDDEDDAEDDNDNDHNNDNDNQDNNHKQKDGGDKNDNVHGNDLNELNDSSNSQSLDNHSKLILKQNPSETTSTIKEQVPLSLTSQPSPKTIFTSQDNHSNIIKNDLFPKLPSSFPSADLPKKFNDRRSISPNAKLLASFTVEQSIGKSLSPPPTTVDFPLKSSFRRQSYSPQELLSFSKSNGLFKPTTSPSRPTPHSIIKHNTQINSRSPSHPVEDNELTPQNRRISLRGSGNDLNSRQSSPTPIQTINNQDSIKPHRLIRTPRSFLIKRRGSLTPLTLPVCGSDPSASVKNLDESDDHSVQTSAKRKVRFDQDVFCLEFDKLPEELPTSRQKQPKLDLSPSQPTTVETEMSSGVEQSSEQNQNHQLVTSSNRQRRRSPRLSTPMPGQLNDFQCTPSSDQGFILTTPILTAPSCPLFDLSGLSLNSDPKKTNNVIANSSTQGYKELNQSENLQSGQAQESKAEDSIFQQLTSRLLGLGFSGQTRPRTLSLPTDLSKLRSPNNLKDLEAQMDVLSLRGSNLDEGKAPSRSFSAPGPVRLSSLSHFSPQLVGVKQIFMEQLSGMGGLAELTTTVLRAFRPLGDNQDSNNSENTNGLGKNLEGIKRSEVAEEPKKLKDKIQSEPTAITPTSLSSTRPRQTAAIRNQNLVQPRPRPDRTLRPRLSNNQRAPLSLPVRSRNQRERMTKPSCRPPSSSNAILEASGKRIGSRN
ncbi:hypothetical protein O181_071857 [Austropuccinia psidii MF-1]|uniref:Uncharacterized protein n=1 Tax=Austropuccinia psidii MF-1 TaxID=1389203 RepID=A0A9Q3F8F5_9BASI|nr:hypothetical protein [Austropuccinia psidii MF-1]